MRVEKYGNGLDLYIAEISRDQMVRMEKACAFLGRFYWRKALHKLWYFDEEKMHDLFGVTSFRQMKSGNHRYLGPVLARKSGLGAFVEGIKIYEGEAPLEIDPSKIRTNFLPTPPLPKPTAANLMVFHGEFYRGMTTFEVQLKESFTLKQLRLNFMDCGDNGFVLQTISYKGKKYYGSEEAEARGFLRPQFIAK